MGQPWKTYVVVALIIGIVVGAAIGWVAKPIPVPVELEERISELESELVSARGELESTKGELASALKEIEELKKPVVIKLTAYCIGPGPIPTTRATNLEWAAGGLNRMLGVIGAKAKIEIEVEYSLLKWGPFAEKFFTRFAAGEAPDIVIGLRDTPKLVEGKFIIALTEHVTAHWDYNYYDFYPPLWDGIKWAGEIWGIPQDATPGCIWYRKDVLRELGYTDAEIEEMLPTTGEGITLDTVAKLAKEAKDAGLVEYGILHRPSPGDTIQVYMHIFGGTAWDPATGKLVLKKSAALSMFSWFKRIVDEGITPKEPPEWKTVHGMFAEAKTFATFASHVGTPSEWKEKYALTDEAFKKDLGFLAFPAAVPEATPLVPLGPLYYLITSQSKYPKIAALILMLATSPEAVVKHSIQTLRPVSRRSVVYHPELEEWPYVYTTETAPLQGVAAPPVVHGMWGTYKKDVFETIKGVEAGILTPESAVAELVEILKADLGNEITITD